MVECGTEVGLAQRVGRYLQNARTERGMTQEAFADLLCTSDRNVRRWLAHGVDSLTTVEQIAAALHVRVEDIFFSKEDVLPPYLQQYAGEDRMIFSGVLCFRQMRRRTIPVLAEPEEMG